MKKILVVLSVLITVAAFSSCEINTARSGKVDYSYGFSKVNSGDLSEMSAIQDAYTTEFKKISGATMENGRAHVVMEGVYSDTDKSIKKACADAEKVLKDKNFTSYFQFHITATYYEDARVDEDFYYKDYGKE